MRVLVTWGSKLGGTVGIARIIGETLERQGFEVTLRDAGDAPDVRGYDAVVVGGALYANRWHRDATRFVARNVKALRRIPVWLFSSGPLDDSADRQDIPPAPQVAELAARVGARGHVTFGGRLLPDVKGFPAAAMAKKMSGDFRNPEHVRSWARGLARALPDATPGEAIDPPGGSPWRLLAHGVLGWALCSAVMGGLLQVASTTVAVALHAVAAPLIFLAISLHYFRAPGARAPLPTALAFTLIVPLLDAVIVAALIMGSFEMFASIAGTWLPFSLIFLTTWITGLIRSTMPWPKPSEPSPTPG